MGKNMSRNKEINGERNKSGQFVVGHTGLGGRPRGSRDRLGQAFVEDFYQKWRSCGTAVLDAVIRDKPHEFLKICASLMPKELHAELDMSLSVIAEARSFDNVARTDVAHNCENGFGLDGAGASLTATISNENWRTRRLRVLWPTRRNENAALRRAAASCKYRTLESGFLYRFDASAIVLLRPQQPFPTMRQAQPKLPIVFIVGVCGQLSALLSLILKEIRRLKHAITATKTPRSPGHSQNAARGVLFR
jgi:hypothetical protein